jgi:hypothetical protein
MNEPFSSVRPPSFREERIGWLLLLLGCVPGVVVGGCAEQQRNTAACEQLVLATCATREHCGGVEAARCAESKAERSCAETPQEARACVLALNDVLTDTCTALPPLSSCPQDLLSSAAYEACVSDGECSTTPDALACIAEQCTQACDERGAVCPGEGACNAAEGRCELSCDDDDQPCAPDRVCSEDRCLTCDEACVDKECGVGTECECGQCVAAACDDDDDCPSDFGCLDEACAACVRNDSGDCVPCSFDSDCVGFGVACVEGGFCV